jgi:hypothetical protein
MEETYMGRAFSALISRWTLLLVVTFGVLLGIHHRLDQIGQSATHVAIVPSTSIR